MHLRASSILGRLHEGMGEERGRRGHLSHPILGTLTKLRFVLDEDSYLVPELDGVRIFSRSTHEFLHEVPGEALTKAPQDLGRVHLGTTAAAEQCSRVGLEP